MTVRFRVLLFAGVAVALVALVGLSLFLLAKRGRLSMENMLAIHQQVLIYGRLSDDAQKYVHDLLHAYESGQDTRPVLQRREKRAEEGFQHLEARIHQQTWRDRRGDLLLVEQLHQTYRNWLRFTEHRVREAVPGRQALLLHDALDDYNKDVAPLLQVAWELENDYLETQVLEDVRSIRVAQRVAAGFPLVALVVMLALALTLLLSLHRSLKDLHEAAGRIGQGDFAHVLPVRAQDEHGEVARAFNRMTAELRDTLREKERLAKAEAEASEREMRRYNALLEDTVHQRTAELEQANTQLTQSLEQLQSTQAQLLFADRLATLGQLAAGVGHEINNPLAFILSNLNYAQQVLSETGYTPSRPQGEEMAEALAEAREGAERVRVIVQDLKMLARPDEEQSGPVDLALVLRSAAKLAAHEVRHRAQLVESVDGVPPVLGSSARLCQVFLNLLINAAHAIEPGQVERHRISLTARTVDSGHVVVEVSDTGCGIAPEHLERIFEPFFTTKPAGVGSGLGLSVCQRIITAHGGSISVTSEPGRGTTFRITLLSISR
jgi:C4-dicarboxylate-specific signal transduction histidine kinase